MLYFKNIPIRIKNIVLKYILEKKKILTWKNIIEYLKKAIQEDINSDRIKIEYLINKIKGYVYKSGGFLETE